MVRASGRPMSAHSRNRAPDAGGADTTGRSNPRSCEERPAPKRDSNRSWASDHAFCASRKRLARFGYSELLRAPIRSCRLNRNETFPLERHDVARERCTIHRHLVGKRVDGRRSLSFQLRQDWNWLVRKPVDAKH